MAPSSANAPQSLAELSLYLFTRREAILTKWRLACEQDPSLGRVSALSREEFNNMILLILEILEERIQSKPLVTDPATIAQTHGLHRWHKSYGLIDTLNELNHLTQTLYSELRTFGQLYPDVDKNLLLDVQQQMTQLMQLTINGSVSMYDELQRLEATGRANTLQQAVDQMQAMSQQRGDVLRESAHDLRGSFGIVNSAAFLLKDDGISKKDRQHFLDMLYRNLGNVQGMITSLMDLSRLEAGQEELQTEWIDVALLLEEIIASAQPMAAERNIILQADGPPSLVVETDRIKFQRIVQNLLLNALKYTKTTPDRRATVSISWLAEGNYRWLFSIQDSGPGLPLTTVGTLAQQLRPTIEPTSVLSPDQADPAMVLPRDLPSIPAPTDMDLAIQPIRGGEGVGLQIVKRLCALLEANLDVESQAGRGTLFRIRMPIRLNV